MNFAEGIGKKNEQSHNRTEITDIGGPGRGEALFLVRMRPKQKPTVLRRFAQRYRIFAGQIRARCIGESVLLLL
jgi:hypothetical protein